MYDGCKEFRVLFGGADGGAEATVAVGLIPTIPEDKKTRRQEDKRTHEDGWVGGGDEDNKTHEDG